MSVLTEKMRGLLLDLATVGPEAYWYPTGGEHRTCEALARLGYLRRHWQPHCYELTQTGHAAVETFPSSPETDEA